MRRSKSPPTASSPHTMLAARQSDLRPDPKAGSADILAPLVFDLALGGALFAGLVALVLVADRTPQTRSRRESGDRDGLLGDLDASEARESRRRGAEDRPAGRQLGPWKGALHWFRVRDRVPNGRGILNSMWKLSIADVGKVAGRDAEVVG